MAFMTLFRETNCAISCRTIVGDYIPQTVVQKIADEYYLITAALELVNVPLSIYIPFTKNLLGKRAAVSSHDQFTASAAAFKANMRIGETPTCIIAAGETNVEKPANVIREFSNKDIGETLFTFLFASRDASSSSAAWLFQILAQGPDFLDRLREESLTTRGGDRTKVLELPMVESLSYTNVVIKEVLRYRRPVIFVPYFATEEFSITLSYTVLRGSMIIPSCWPALHDPQVYPNPEQFDPERWLSGDADSPTKNWLVFGAGHMTV